MRKKDAEANCKTNIQSCPEASLDKCRGFITTNDGEGEVEDNDRCQESNRKNPFSGCYQRKCPLSLNDRSARRPSDGQMEIEEIEHGVASM